LFIAPWRSFREKAAANEVHRKLPKQQSIAQTARVLITISDVSVRWPGHLFAISSSLFRYSS
jgi:hypothetical protein